MGQLTLQQKLDMANKTVHGLMQEVDEQKKKQKAGVLENEQLKSKIKELDEENTKADAIIADRERYIKRTDARNEQLMSELKDLLERMKNDKEEIRSLQLQIRKLTNDLEEAKLDKARLIPNLPEGVSGVSYKLGEGSFPVNIHSGANAKVVPLSGGSFAMIMPTSPNPPQTPAQQIMSILKQLDSERMILEYSQVSREVLEIVSTNKANSAAAYELLKKLA